MYLGLNVKCSLFCPNVAKSGMCRQILLKASSTNLHTYSLVGVELFPAVKRTDRHDEVKFTLHSCFVNSLKRAFLNFFSQIRHQ